MKLLALETAAEACSAALLIDGEISQRFAVEPRRHSELILPMLDALLADAGLKPRQLDAIAFGRGPGSFTGVRIATAVTQGVAFAADIPVLPVSTLAALALRAMHEHAVGQVLAGFDARMSEVYWGCYRAAGEGVELIGEERVCPAPQVPLPDGDGWFGAGSAFASYGTALAERLAGRLSKTDPELLCRAREIAQLAAIDFERGRAVPAEQALPVYLRDKVAKKKGER